MLRKFFDDSDITRKDFSIVFILLVNVFAWFYMTPLIIEDVIINTAITSSQYFIIWSGYYAAIIIASIIGSFLAKKIERINFILIWIIFGMLASLVPALFNNSTFTSNLTTSILLGASFGIGMPTCLAYFSDITKIENRGRISGVTLLTANFIAPFFAIALSSFSLTINAILFASWRAIALIVLILKPSKPPTNTASKDSTSYLGIIKDKTFGFYIIAWLMFCLVDRIAGPIVSNSLGDLTDLLSLLGPVIASISAFITGILSDWVGRKRIVLYGFIALGIAYALAGIIPADVIFTKYLVVLISSATTGILFVTFILILWGDLSQFGSREKYYALGSVPFFFTKIIELFITANDIQIPETSTFSVAAFFLFVAVLPLLYAPETLPQKNMELRRLKKFAEDAKKVKDKYEDKK